MKILAHGEKIRTEELKQKLSSVDCDLKVIDAGADLSTANLKDFDVIFDLSFEDDTNHLKYFSGLNGKIVFVSAANLQLAKVRFDFGHELSCTLFGLNALPTFINRHLAEVSLLNEEGKAFLDQTMKALNWDYKIVADRVGMVTPRIIFMIINEACYTVQEGTASMADIDTSMKLGTNYPFGPFEWADRIGIKYIYETLEAIYHDTRDERYKICPLLKKNYLEGRTFYSGNHHPKKNP